MANTFACQTGHIGKEGDDVGRGQSSLGLIRGCNDPKRANRRRIMTRHPPKLPREFCGRCLPIGTGDSRNMIWKWLEKRRGKMCKGLARIGFGNVHRAAHHRFGPRNHRHSASGRIPSVLKKPPSWISASMISSPISLRLGVGNQRANSAGGRASASIVFACSST